MIALVFIIGLVTGFFDSTIGAGGLFCVPSLILLGLPPQVAIATDRFGTIGQSLTAGYAYWKAKKIVWKYVPIFAILSLGGAAIGTSLLLTVDAGTLQKIISVLSLLLLIIVIAKRDVGVKHVSKSMLAKTAGLVLYFLLMIFGGFFGQGMGPLLAFVLMYFIGLTLIEVLATSIIPWLVLSVASSVLFGLRGLINYQLGVVLLVGMSLGGYLGARVAIQKGDLWVKRLFVLFVIVISAKLLFFR